MNKTNRDVRLENVKAVIEKLKFVRNPQMPYLDNNSLSTLGIQLSHLSPHDENGIDFEPRFPKPFSAQKFDELFEKAEKDEWRVYGMTSLPTGGPTRPRTSSLSI
jgi:hypothetical protein